MSKNITGTNLMIGSTFDNRGIQAALSSVDELTRKQQQAEKDADKVKLSSWLKSNASGPSGMDKQAEQARRDKIDEMSAASRARELAAWEQQKQQRAAADEKWLADELAKEAKATRQKMEFEQWYTAELAKERAQRLADQDKWLDAEIANEQKAAMAKDAARLQGWLKSNASGPSGMDKQAEQARRDKIDEMSAASRARELAAWDKAKLQEVAANDNKNKQILASNQEFYAQQAADLAAFRAQQKAQAATGESDAYQNWLRTKTTGQTGEEAARVQSLNKLIKAKETIATVREQQGDIALRKQADADAVDASDKIIAGLRTQREVATDNYNKRMQETRDLAKSRRPDGTFSLTDEQIVARRAQAKDLFKSESGDDKRVKNFQHLLDLTMSRAQLEERAYQAVKKQADEMLKLGLLSPKAHADVLAVAKNPALIHPDDAKKALDAQHTAAIAAMHQEAAVLNHSLLTEKEKFALRKQSDLDHLAMLRQFNAIDDMQLAKLQKKAGTLGLGNVPGDNNMNNRGFQGAMMAQQVGFGIQDFTSQMVNAKTTADGLGRGIMSVSNNVQMLGAAFGPTALAVTAIGGAVAGIVLPAVIKWVMNTEELERAAKQLEKEYSGIADHVRFISGIQQQDTKGVLTEKRRLQKEMAVDAAAELEMSLRSTKAVTAANKAQAEYDALVDKHPVLGRNRRQQDVINMAWQEMREKKAIAMQEAETATAEAKKQFDKKIENNKKLLGMTGAAERAEAMEQYDKARDVEEQQTDAHRVAEYEKLQQSKDRLSHEAALIKQQMATATAAERMVLKTELEHKKEEYDKLDKELTDKHAKAVEARSNIERDKLAKGQKELDAARLEDEKRLIDLDIRAEQDKQAALNEEKDKFSEAAKRTPAASVAASVRGTAAATSAINRALAGTRSEENYAKQQVERLDALVKSSNKIEQKLNFAKRDLGS